MSSFQSFGQTFAIHSDNSENQGNIGLRKTKRDDLQGRPPATKRAALGTITNTTRIQPVRTAKQNSNQPLHNDENFQEKVAKKDFCIPQSTVQPQFTIHVDTQSAGSQVRPKLETTQLNPALTALRPVLAEVKPELANSESPMLLDTSLDLHRTTDETAEQRLTRVLTVPEYSEEIYAYLREAELKYRPKVGYMKKQPDINNSMRSILIDWLVEVAEEYRLLRETLFLAVNYIDRFLSQMSVLRGKLQLVGAASIFLASKYEEIYPPEVHEFVYITDDTYTQKQVLKMEHLVLKVLSFDVAIASANVFCERFLNALGCVENDETYSLAMYLCELSLVDSETFLRFVPSEIAASAVCLANHTLGKEPWPQHMVETTKYSYQNMLECTQALYATLIRAPAHPQQAVREKYRQTKYKEVANLTPPTTLPYQELVMMLMGQLSS